MSYGQWMFEAAALRRKDRLEREWQQKLTEEIFKSSVKSLREVMIHVLGLHIGAGKGKDGEPTPYIPFALYCGRPEFLEEMIKKDEADEKLVDALDQDQDSLHEGLANLDSGDLEPIFSGALSDDPLERWRSKENQEFLKSIGIDLVDNDGNPVQE